MTMFLSLLNTNQKLLFTSLVYNLAASDGDVSEDERMVIESYSAEMEMEISLENVDADMDNIISQISNMSGVREKKIIVFEMIGLAMADSNFDEGEREIVRKALRIFNLDVEFGDFCERKIAEYLKLQEELNLKILS